MNKSILLGCLFALLMMSPSAAVADFERTKIAVLDFTIQGKGDDTEDMGQIVAEWLITAFVKEGRFDVIERRLLKKILGEQELGATGVLDQDSVSQLGKLLGVKVVISGSVMRFQNIIEVNARIIDVESASIIAAESVKDTSAIG
ncbi:MAG: FlgO family outer membrane protein, partial [Desulfobacterales bacterium]